MRKILLSIDDNGQVEVDSNLTEKEDLEVLITKFLAYCLHQGVDPDSLKDKFVPAACFLALIEGLANLNE